MHNDNHDQAGYHDRQRDESDTDNGTPARRELARNDPALGMEVPMVAQEEDDDADAQERGT